MLRFLLTLALAASLAAPAFSFQDFPAPAEPVSEAFALWQAEHGSHWLMRTRVETGTARFLYGGRLPAAFVPQGDAEFLELAEHALDLAQPMFQAAVATLEPVELHFLPMSRAGLPDKLAALFRQQQDGVPVVGGGASVLMTPAGEVLALDSTALPGVERLDTRPALDRFAAVTIAGREYRRLEGRAARRIENPMLVIYPHDEGGTLRPRLAWSVEMHTPDAAGLPSGRRMVVSAGARSGAVLAAEQLVHSCFQGPNDLSGSVESWATPGVDPDTGANPETLHRMRHMQLSSSAGSTVTDGNGNFIIPGAGGAVNVTASYSGPYCQVENLSGGNHSAGASFSPGVPGVLEMNAARAPEVTSQANAYDGVMDFRAFLKSVDPNENTMDFQVTANVNLGACCNAFYNGSSINFYIACSGCVNTAYSTVVAHEEGHWANVLEGSGNGSDGFGEGNADVYAMYIYDTPIVGEDFCGSGCHIRTGLNTRQFCGDSNPSCHGGVHNNGEVLMGALWKVRRNLDLTHGNASGDLIADTLFVNWMNAYDDGQIRTFIEDHWLALDDDDGNIANGTPNYADIDGAFRDQGFPGVDLALVAIAHNPLADTQDETGPYLVDAAISSAAGAILSADLKYRVNGGGVQTAAMVNTGGDNWRGEIPGQTASAAIDYHIEAQDTASNSGRDPESGDYRFNVTGAGPQVHVECLTWKEPRRGRDLSLTVSVKDDAGGRVGGAAVMIEIFRDGSSIGTASKSTSGRGKVTFKLKNAASGCYTVDVLDVVESGYGFDGSEPVNGHQKGVDSVPDADCAGGGTLCGQN